MVVCFFGSGEVSPIFGVMKWFFTAHGFSSSVSTSVKKTLCTEIVTIACLVSPLCSQEWGWGFRLLVVFEILQSVLILSTAGFLGFIGASLTSNIRSNVELGTILRFWNSRRHRSGANQTRSSVVLDTQNRRCDPMRLFWSSFAKGSRAKGSKRTGLLNLS